MVDKVTSRIGKITCKIFSDDEKIETGFLICLAIPSFTKPLLGLMTNNRVLPVESLQNNCSIHCSFEIDNKAVPLDFTLGEDRLRFTDPLLDYTFIQINSDELKFEGEPLSVNEKIDIKQEIIIAQHLKGQSLFFVEGTILSLWGSNFIYEGNSQYGSSGCAVCTLSGEVVGLHRSGNMGTSIYYIQKSIEILNGSASPNSSYELARALTAKDKEELKSHGLSETPNPYVFISRAALFVTPLWFFRSNHAWYWTPVKPKDFSQEELDRCNWMMVWSGEQLEVKGGCWDGIKPAKKNIVLIEWLISTELQYLQ